MGHRVAIVASGITSPLFSALAFAENLRTAGYTVIFFAPAASAVFIAHAGFDHIQIPEPKLSTLTPLLAPPGQNLADPQDRAGRIEAAIGAFGIDGLVDDLRAQNPTCIFVDCELHAHIVVALSLGVPVVQTSNMFLSPPSLEAPPLHKKITPGRGFAGSRYGVALAWGHYFFRKWTKLLRRRLRDRGADHPSALRALARRHNVPIAQLRRFASWQLPWTYRLPTALFLPQALDLPTRPYKDLSYLGPMIWTNRPIPDHDAETVARFCQDETGAKRIYVAFGSMMTPENDLIRHLWKVAERHADWRFLFVVGTHWAQRPSDLPPDNVDVVTWANQPDVLALVDLAIIHGGTSSLVEAVDAATPMLIYPHVLDQWGSAARVVFHDLGIEGDPKDSVDKIEEDISTLLADPQIKIRCKEMQEACRSELRTNAAAQLCDQFAKPNRT